MKRTRPLALVLLLMVVFSAESNARTRSVARKKSPPAKALEVYSSEENSSGDAHPHAPIPVPAWSFPQTGAYGYRNHTSAELRQSLRDARQPPHSPGKAASREAERVALARGFRGGARAEIPAAPEPDRPSGEIRGPGVVSERVYPAFPQAADRANYFDEVSIE